MKLGVVSCYFINNYGSVLQSYALQEYLCGKGAVCDTISAEGLKPYLNAQKKRYYLHNCYRIGLFLAKLPLIRLKVLQKLNINRLGERFCERRDKFDAFRKRIRLSQSSASSLAELTALSTSYDAVILGSDQLWRPDNIYPDYYTLSWVPNEVKRCSYATSFGVSHLDGYSMKKAAEFLPRFSAISVREQNGCSIVKAASGKEAVVVCDPVFLLPQEEWRCIADASACPEGKYIFAYFLGSGAESRRFLHALSQQTGLPIAAVIHNDSYVAADESIDYPLASCGPEEFIGLIAGAEYVCTDSFHAMAFSTIFRRSFFAFNRFRSRKHGTNSRVRSFLHMIGLENRLIGENDGAALDTLPIDYDTVSVRLDAFIAESKEYLNDIMGDAHHAW